MTRRIGVGSVASCHLLRRHEAAFVQMTTTVRESKWPAVPWRVDVTAYPNYRAGYTTSEGHIVMFSTDPGNQNLYSLEMLLHEVQHAEAIEGTMPTSIATCVLCGRHEGAGKSLARDHLCDGWRIRPIDGCERRHCRLHAVLDQRT